MYQKLCHQLAQAVQESAFRKGIRSIVGGQVVFRAPYMNKASHLFQSMHMHTKFKKNHGGLRLICAKIMP